MKSIRQRQIAEMIKRSFAVILREQGSYIYGSKPFVTVTNVWLSPDQSLARIYISVYNVENKQEVILHLDAENSQMRKLLGNRIGRQVRRIPELEFFLDDTVDEMYRVEALLNEVREKDKNIKSSSDED